MNGEQRAWFEAEGMLRYAVEADENGVVEEDVRGPVVALGPRDEDFVYAPIPEEQGYPIQPLARMTLDDYNNFLYRWLEEAVRAGVVQCYNCGRAILDDYDDLPDEDTWDAIMIEKELVAWMVVHFDCKKPLPKKLKGLHPFELSPREAPVYDLSGVSVPDADDDIAEADSEQAEH